jgi:hypothetical protein
VSSGCDRGARQVSPKYAEGELGGDGSSPRGNWDGKALGDKTVDNITALSAAMLAHLRSQAEMKASL